MTSTQPANSFPDPASTAIVIGGSMAGLLAERVLADHFGQVLVLERDQTPQGAGPRRGVPQARFIHVLLSRGRLILEDLFPGMDAELEASGAPALSWTADTAWHSQEGWGNMDQIISLATERPEIQVLFIEVAHLLRPPAAFFRPGVLAQVLKRAFRKADEPHPPALEDRLQAG